MKNLLEWMEKEGFVRGNDKDKPWYSPKRYKGTPSKYYLHEELIELYEKAKKNNENISRD